MQLGRAVLGRITEVRIHAWQCMVLLTYILFSFGVWVVDLERLAERSWLWGSRTRRVGASVVFWVREENAEIDA